MKRSGGYVSQPTGYKAFIPTPLPPEPPLVIEGDLTKKLAQATLLLARLDGLAYTLPNTDLFITMYVKKEALLSSQIEGTQASLEDIFDFESGMAIDNINDVEEVVNYVKALNYGIERLKTFPMSLRLIKELHSILLTQTRGKEKTPGEFKRSQNWIGAPNSNLHTAIFIPPPPAETLQALSDLEKYMYTDSSLPELIDCALIHYQFETIHPFLDGNGRVGRLLITLYLFWKGIVEKPLLYLSYYFKKNRQEYYDRLTMVRTTGDYEQWVNFFLKGVIETSESAIDNTKKILKLQAQDQALLLNKKVSSPLSIALLSQLFYTPIVSIADVQKTFKVTTPTASHLINQFVDLGIMREVTGKKRAKRFVYSQYLAILSEGTAPLAP
jgi:Fic family protein